MGRAQPGSPRWRSKGYRCIGGVLYRVSANKLSKTCSRPGGGGDGEGASRPLLRAGEAPAAQVGTCQRLAQPAPPWAASRSRRGTDAEAPEARSPGRAPAGGGSRLAGRPLLPLCSLLDRGDEPGLVTEAGEGTPGAAAPGVAWAAPPSCVWRRRLGSRPRRRKCPGPPRYKLTRKM